MSHLETVRTADAVIIDEIAERRGTYRAICSAGETGGIRVAVAPVPSWILLLGTAAALTLVIVATIALAWLIAMGLDALFFAAGQWSGK